jgi:hypothetical protein
MHASWQHICSMMHNCTVKMFAFCRTIDSFIVGYAKQALSIFLVDLDLIMDVVSFKIKHGPNLEKGFCLRYSKMIEPSINYRVLLRY